MTQPTEKQMERARAIAANTIGTYRQKRRAINIGLGLLDNDPTVQAALAAIIETQEACAMMAECERVNDVGPGDDAYNNACEHIAAAIRAGVGDEE